MMIIIILTILISLLVGFLIIQKRKIETFNNIDNVDNVDNTIKEGYFWQQACLDADDGLDPTFFCVDTKMFIHDDEKCIEIPKPQIDPYMCEEKLFNLTPSKDLKKCKKTQTKIVKNVYDIDKVYKAGKKNFDLTTNKSDVPLETPQLYPIVPTTCDFKDKKEIGIVFGNRMCWLSEDLENPQTKGLPDNVYPLKLNCHQRGDKFTIERVGKTYTISKEKNGKKCYLIYTLDGTNRGFSYGNVALSYDSNYNRHKEMVMSRCGDHYKIHPKLRKRCYLKSFKTNRGVIPIFQCYSTPLSAITIGDKVSFI